VRFRSPAKPQGLATFLRSRSRHTSADDPGQIYVPIVNTVLMVGVLGIVIAFGNSARLAAAYGIAVTGTMLITTILYFSRVLHRRARYSTAVIGLLCLIITIDFTFLAANFVKIPNGGWLPLAVAVLVFVVMANWHTGHDRLARLRSSQEGPIGAYVARLESMRPPVRRVPGLAVFLTRAGDTSAPALRAVVERIHALHEQVVIVTVEVDDVPLVPAGERASVETLGLERTAILRVRLRFGFNDPQSVPRALRHALGTHAFTGPAELEDATYFVSPTSLTIGRSHGLSRLRQRLYVATARAATDPIRYYDLPAAQTLIVGNPVILD
jgi:KUP system potassium uptake protein